MLTRTQLAKVFTTITLTFLVVPYSAASYGQDDGGRPGPKVHSDESPKSFSSYLSDLRKAAEQGDADSQFTLGYNFYNGFMPFERDYAEGRKWLQRAAEQGHAEGQYWFALSLRYNDRQSEAVRWFLRAAEQGHDVAQWYVGIYYHNGSGGLPKDLAEAAKWYRRAVEQGNEDAKIQLANVEWELRAEEKEVPRDVCAEQSAAASTAGGPSARSVCHALANALRERMDNPNGRLADGMHRLITGDTSMEAARIGIGMFRLKRCSRDDTEAAHFVCDLTYRWQAGGDPPPVWFTYFMNQERNKRFRLQERGDGWRIVLDPETTI